ncbi:tape-measure protein [Streptomyces sp. TBY4]|uniref:tape-measure protein n=1 Tax=Streptomyces sp. TBY4 TaxID=2962030 RepID=UPI0020B6ABB3|nr:tape-measure protein [Streptomyces sp. TBY4]MCP3760146.1 tape-measure protein [Streptomyces sp. TBY4]
MSAAAAALNPLGGLTRGFRALTGPMGRAGQAAGQASASLRQFTTAVRGADTATARLAPAAAQAAKVLAGLKAQAAAATGSANRIGGSASRASTGARRTGAGAAGPRSALLRIGRGAGGVLALLGRVIDLSGILGTLMGTFGIAMTAASVAMTAANVAMRANPLGFLLGILVPVGAWLIELALNSETGGRLMEELFAYVEKVFEEQLKFLLPLLKAVGEIVSSYFKGYFAVVTGVLALLRGDVGGLSRAGGSVDSATRSLRSIASGAFNAVMDPIRPVITFLTSTLPGSFARVSGALSSSLGGIGRMVTTGLQAVLAVVTGPFNGMIAFANWIIDGLQKLSFSFFGKKFGVKLDKIPMLAEGGVVWPVSMGQDPRIHPVSDLDHRRVPPAGPHDPRRAPYRVEEFREEAGAGPRAVAEDLLFLASAHA